MPNGSFWFIRSWVGLHTFARANFPHRFRVELQRPWWITLTPLFFKYSHFLAALRGLSLSNRYLTLSFWHSQVSASKTLLCGVLVFSIVAASPVCSLRSMVTSWLTFPTKEDFARQLGTNQFSQRGGITFDDSYPPSHSHQRWCWSSSTDKG